MFEERVQRSLKKAVALAGIAKPSLGAYLAPQFCHSLIAIGYRHSHGAGAAGPQRREHDHDLHPCPEGRGGWNNLSIRFVVGSFVAG